MLGLLFRWIAYSLSIMFVAWIVPGIHVKNFGSSMLVAVVLALINAFIKPLLMAISLPINFLTLGLFTLVINAFLFWLVGKITPNFEVENFWVALLGSLILSLLAMLIGKI